MVKVRTAQILCLPISVLSLVSTVHYFICICFYDCFVCILVYLYKLNSHASDSVLNTEISFKSLAHSHIYFIRYFYLFCYFLGKLLKTFKALNGLLCADVTLRNYSLIHIYFY